MRFSHREYHVVCTTVPPWLALCQPAQIVPHLCTAHNSATVFRGWQRTHTPSLEMGNVGRAVAAGGFRFQQERLGRAV
jgi:hypothetical protein